MIDVLDDLADGSLAAHTSIVLAYNVDLLVYDKLLRRRFASAGVTSQIVFCDATPYAASLDAIDPSSRVGHAYSVTPVRVEGAFHPKAYLLLGRRGGRLVLGSGNASLGGLVRNAEVFGRFEFNAETDVGPHPAFRQVFELAKSLGAKALPAVRAQIARAEQWTPWLADADVPDGRVVRIGGPGRPPLFDSVRDRTRAPGVRRIIAMSSSFDRKLDAAKELAAVGGGKHETVVVVQPDRVTVDGLAVGRLGDATAWTEFVDPRPSKKKDPRDSYLHAKLILVEAQKSDHLFFGSANLSRPALLDGKNVEIVVELPPEPAGTWMKRLNLGESLKVDARPSLLKLRWADGTDERDDELLHLSGVEWSPGEGWIVLAEGDLDASTRLALGAVRSRPDQLLQLRQRKDQVTLAAASAPHDGVRFAWLVDKSGKPLSNPVALTWPDVARARIGGWFGNRVEQAILSMKHGELLGHVLFEFLDRVPDLGVLAVAQLRQGGGTRRAEESKETAGERTEASFYTEATASSEEAARLALGDRSDLDLLASLVQPLGVSMKSDADDPYDDDEDDEGIEEEAERRGLDTSKAADGSERVPTTRLPTAKRMHSAGRRFARRVDLAASALGETLEAVDEDLVLPPSLVARQVWMMFIAAFVAGRSVETSDGGDQIVVEANVLAYYAMQCAVFLAGDGRGGLLRHVDVAAWPTREGKTLADGLRFMVAACAWATAWFETVWEPAEASWDHDDEAEYAQGIHDAMPLFVLARLLVAAGNNITEPDFADAARRIAAWDDVPIGKIRGVYERARKLADWLETVDANPESAAIAGDATPGSAVVLNKSGVGIVVAVHKGLVRVAMLSRPGKPIVQFVATKARVVTLPAVGLLMLAPISPDVVGG